MKKITLIFIILTITIAKAQNWTPLGTVASPGPYGVKCAAVYNGELYAGGGFSTAGSVVAFNIAKWNGSLWSIVGSGLSGGTAQAMVIYNGDLCVLGGFNIAGGISLGYTSGIAKWDGVNWSSLGTSLPPAFSFNQCRAMVVYNNGLVVGGQGGATEAQKWDGSSWSLFGSGTGTIICKAASAFCIYNNDLYAAGTFSDTTSSFTGICRWNGSQWSNITGAVVYTPDVKSMCVFNGEMYMTGGFTSIGGITCNNIAKWNGSNWIDVSVPFNYIVGSSLYVYNNILYLGHGGDYILPNNMDVLKFDGLSWLTTTVDGITGSGPYYSPLLVWNSDLYTVGSPYFIPNAGGISKLHVATAIDEIESLNGITISPNPFTSQTTISFSQEQKNTTIIITDVLGKQIKTQTFSGKQLIIEKGEMEKGIYFIQITDENKNVINKKIIIQ